MLFNSYVYLLCFLPVTLVVYFLLGRRAKWAVVWLVLASLFFYGFWNPNYLPLIAGSIAANFCVAQLLRRFPERSKPLLIVGVGGNLALLGVFKYAVFFLESVAGIAGAAPPALPIVLPLGISFFTFTQIAYLVDVSRGKAEEPSLANYALFVTFFPHLLAGPILHHSEMMPQFAATSNKRPYAAHLAAGLFLLAVGLAKKVFLADQLAPLADAGFAQPDQLSLPGAWLAVLAYTLQIYFDFSGYTDMALGAALLFNIRMPPNFDSPYQARNLRDFWLRWHMTLSRFLRDYLYVPLGGNRHGAARTACNVMVTFMLGGLWHGAAWTFVVWGTLHGLGVVVVRLWERTGVRLPYGLAWGMTFLFVMITWVFFRARTMADALAVLRAMVGLSQEPFRIPDLSGQGTPAAMSALLVIAALMIVATKKNSNVLVTTFEPDWRTALFAGSALTLAVLQFAQVSPFLYFNF
ncbi:MAG: MBOAT family protein [Betaproteobacteria bacterium]|nr:MBOAT family protein [Betaproteobacteria bacterium]